MAVPPRVRFLERKTKAEQKKAASKSKVDQSPDDDGSEDDQPGMVSHEPAQVQAQQSYDFKASMLSIFYLHTPYLIISLPGLSDSDDDVLTLKRKDHALEAGVKEDESDAEDLTLKRGEKVGKKSVTKAALAKKILKKKIVANKKTVFDEEGTVFILCVSTLPAIFHCLNF